MRAARLSDLVVSVVLAGGAPPAAAQDKGKTAAAELESSAKAALLKLYAGVPSPRRSVRRPKITPK